MRDGFRPTRDAVLMEVAQTFATLATCSRDSVGVVIALEGRVVATGYNGAPKGMPHCEHGCSCIWAVPLVQPELHEPNCAMHPDNGCKVAVHGEANAIAFAARHGLRIEGATLYTTFSPCLPCAQLIVNSGIVRIVAGASYRDQEGMRLLVRAGLELT